MMGNDLRELLWEAAPPMLPPTDGLDRARRRARAMRRRATATRLVALPLTALLLVAAVATIRDSSRVSVVPAEPGEQEPRTEDGGTDEEPAMSGASGHPQTPTKSKSEARRNPASAPAAPAPGVPPAPGRVLAGKMTFTDEKGLWTMALDGTGRRLVTSERYTAYGWAADGRSVVVGTWTSGSNQRATVSLLDTTTGRLTLAVDHPGYHVSSAQMSPDGKHFVFAAFEDADITTQSDPGDHLFIADADGRNVRRLPYGGRDPTWAPDSRRIAFHCGEGAYDQTDTFLCIVGIDGTGLRGAGNFIGPVAWSPDGQWLVARSYGGFSIFRPDGTGERKVPARAKFNIPQWTPDSRHLVYVRHVEERSYAGTMCQAPPCDEAPGVYAVPVDGGNHIRLTTGKNDDSPVVTR